MAKRKKVIKSKAKRKKVVKPNLDPALIKRAKKIGLNKQQIANFTNAAKLKEYLDGISPQTNPDAKRKSSTLPKPVIHSEPMPDKFELESRMENNAISRSRSQFDENSLQAKLRSINRRYGPGKPVKIVKTVHNIPVSGWLTTKFEIFMKG